MTTNRQDEPQQKLDAWLALTGQIPAPAHPVSLPMLSGSMAPLIPVGAVMEIVIRPGQACRTGDVAIFESGGRLVAHRILLVLGFGTWRVLLEKGDANPGGQWRPVSAVRGRVTGFVTGPGSPRQDPGDPAVARLGRRRHLRHWLTTLGGWLSSPSREGDHE